LKKDLTNPILYGIINTEVRKETNRKNKRSRLKVTERKSIMANTMKKSEVLANARESALATLGLLDVPGVRQIGPCEFAFPAGESPDGETVYARVKVSAANYKATEKTPAFDIEGAAGDYAVEVEEKAKAAAEKAAERERKAASKRK
jgi:hypothetical protein